VRGEDDVSIHWPGFWPLRPPATAIPLASVRSVSSQRTTESSLDDAVMTAAIGGARTGPLGVALGAAIGRRRRIVRTVHVSLAGMGEPVELVFRPLDDAKEAGVGALMRIFASDHATSPNR
jgi:hypothetical protein